MIINVAPIGCDLEQRNIASAATVECSKKPRRNRYGRSVSTVDDNLLTFKTQLRERPPVASLCIPAHSAAYLISGTTLSISGALVASACLKITSSIASSV